MTERYRERQRETERNGRGEMQSTTSHNDYTVLIMIAESEDYQKFLNIRKFVVP